MRFPEGAGRIRSGSAEGEGKYEVGLDLSVDPLSLTITVICGSKQIEEPCSQNRGTMRRWKLEGKYEITQSEHCLGHKELGSQLVSHEKHRANFVYIYIFLTSANLLNWFKPNTHTIQLAITSTTQYFYITSIPRTRKYIFGGSTTAMLEARSSYRKSPTKSIVINSLSDKAKRREACGSMRQTKALQLLLRFSSPYLAASMDINACM